MTDHSELGVFKFIERCPHIPSITLFSNLTKMKDVADLNERETAKCDRLLKTAVERAREKYIFNQSQGADPKGNAFKKMTRTADYFYSYDLSNNHILIKSVCANLMNSKSVLKNLVLAGIQFNAWTMNMLSSALKDNITLDRIQLSFCLFTDDVIRSIHIGLGSCSNLKEIDLSNNGL